MENFCAYCSVVMTSEADFQAHCLSESHQLMIMSDEGREWKFRPPARGVPADQYVLCPMFCMSGKCRLGQQCCDAHGEEELNEWKERYGYRQMKLQHAKDCRLQGSSYSEQLLEKWLATPNPQNIMKERVEGVDIAIDPETNLTVSEKNCCREWTFKISTQHTLQHVALLYETHRSHFRLSQLAFNDTSSNSTKEFNLGAQCQEWNNGDNSGGHLYICKVRFVTSIYGTFHQAVVFDFGFEPVLIQKLSVDVVSISDLEKLQQARDTVMTFTERWSSDDIVVAPFENKPYSIGENEKSLLSCYPAPDTTKFTVTQAVMEPMLTKDNYSTRLHELLCIEEMSQHELLSRYNVKASLKLTSCYLLTPNSAATAKYAHNGGLFASMKLSSVLSEDSSSGRLILTNCSTVLVAPARSKGKQPKKVYEALIEDKGKTVIYIRLSKLCTEELGLLPDKEFMAEVQFQLNRLPLCEMHFAVDKLHPPSLVFPSLCSLPPVLWNTENSEWFKNLDVQLNSKQKEAVLAITAPIALRLPPVLIIGPFGTGKTFTLAQAVKLLLADSSSRVLVCTHSNSAADIYIREYLHPEVAEGKTEATPLRIYYRHRWVATVHPTVLQYCLVSTTECDRSFNMPTVEDVKKHKVVVTTLSTSRYLVQLGLEKGFFTHILIDEAAQAMECEAIMPLSMASEGTRIVLAGDHMQLSPEVYSEFAQERNLHTSLLERLYDLYPENFTCKILLCENYRSHEAIIQYTSELFYDNHLIASAKQPRHEKYYPLTFFTARGEDVQDVNSTAYHNNAEVYEIVERVIELKKSWPEVWGDQDETSIGVVTPYYDQVVRIRAELRKKKLHGVSVERVLNVQGKQFRVIFLSAVRTRQTCSSRSKAKESDLDHGFLSNARLLNTAITRAQSLVAVVGDPVSLCSVGKCRKLWEKFILTCHKEDSLFGITWDSLRSHLDSMELKKNFILNPLAPEFVPGRMFHGQQNNPSSDFVCLPPTTPQTQPWLFIPVPSPFQGPPIMQSALPHIVPPPHPYNLALNCNVGQSLIAPPPPAMAHAFTSFAAAPPPPPQSLPQAASSLQPRLNTGIFARRLNPPRIPMEQSSQVKDFERSQMLGRAIKRNVSYPAISNNIAKQTIARAVEDRNRNSASILEEARRIMARNELQSNAMMMGGSIVENGGFQANVFDKINNTNVQKIDEEHNSMKPPIDVAMYNGFQDRMVPLGLKISSSSSSNSGNNRFALPSQKPLMDSESCDFNLDIGLPAVVENFHQTSPHYQNNGTPAAIDRDQAIVAALDELLFSSQQQNSCQPADRWPPCGEVSRLEAFQASLQEKLALLEKILPTGTDLRNFLESPVPPKLFFTHLLSNKGPVVAKKFVNLMTSIKQDQDTLIRYHQFVSSFPERVSGVRELSNGLSHHLIDSPALALRAPQNPASVAQTRPINQSDGLVNGYDPFKFESPITLSRSILNDKSDTVRPSVINEGKNGYVKTHNVMTNMMKLRDLPLQSQVPQHQPINETFMNGPANEKYQEQLLYEMRNMSLSFRSETNSKVGSAHEIANFQRESVSEAVRRAELERQLRDSQKNLWVPLSQQAEQQHPVPEPTYDSYLSKLRSISSTASTNVDQSPAFEAANQVVKSEHDAPAQMTPFSMSYPDIPDILPTQLSGKEPETPRIIQKPSQPRNESQQVTTNAKHTQQFLYNIAMQQQKQHHQQQNGGNNTSLSYSSEGMTYAKILRSPHP